MWVYRDAMPGRVGAALTTPGRGHAGFSRTPVVLSASIFRVDSWIIATIHETAEVEMRCTARSSIPNGLSSQPREVQ